MDSKHSPLPWAQDPRVPTYVQGPNRRGICSTGGYSDNRVDQDVLHDENHANAALIVTAVNAHESLTARNRRLEAALRGLVFRLDSLTSGEFSNGGDHIEREEARAALSETTDGNEQKARG